MIKNSNAYYYTFDGLGSVTDLTDGSETVQEQYSYDSFGKIATAPTTGNLYTYTSREYDAESGLYFYRARTYDPTLGRFLQVDPLGFVEDTNMFSYVGNNSINNTDPLGLFTESDCDTIYKARVTICKSYTSKKERALCFADAAEEYAQCLRNAKEPDPDGPDIPNPGDNFCNIQPPYIPPFIPPIRPFITPAPINSGPVYITPISLLNLEQNRSQLNR